MPRCKQFGNRAPLCFLPPPRLSIWHCLFDLVVDLIPIPDPYQLRFCCVVSLHRPTGHGRIMKFRTDSVTEHYGQQRCTSRSKNRICVGVTNCGKDNKSLFCLKHNTITMLFTEFRLPSFLLTTRSRLHNN